MRRYYRVRELGEVDAPPPRGADRRRRLRAGGPPGPPDRHPRRYDRLAWTCEAVRAPRRRGARRPPRSWRDLYVWRGAPSRSARPTPTRAGSREALAGAGLPRPLRAAWPSRSAGTGRHAQYFTFRPSRRRLRGAGPLPRHAPHDGHAAGAVAAARTSRSSGCRRPRTSTSSTASAATTRGTSGFSPSPRCATSRPCATRRAAWSRCPQLEHMLLEALAGMRRVPGAARAPRAAAVEPASCSTSGRRSTCRRDELVAWCAASRRSPRGSALEKVRSAAASPTARRGELRDRVLRISRTEEQGGPALPHGRPEHAAASRCASTPKGGRAAPPRASPTPTR